MRRNNPFIAIGCAITVYVLLHAAAASLCVLCGAIFPLVFKLCILMLDGPMTWVDPQLKAVLLLALSSLDIKGVLISIYVAFGDFLLCAFWRIVVPLVILKLISIVVGSAIGYLSSEIRYMVSFDIALPLSCPVEIAREKEMRELDALIKEFQKIDSAGGTWRLWCPRMKPKRKHRRKQFNGKKRCHQGRRYWSSSPRKQRKRAFRRVKRALLLRVAKVGSAVTEATSCHCDSSPSSSPESDNTNNDNNGCPGDGESCRTRENANNDCGSSSSSDASNIGSDNHCSRETKKRCCGTFSFPFLTIICALDFFLAALWHIQLWYFEKTRHYGWRQWVAADPSRMPQCLFIISDRNVLAPVCMPCTSRPGTSELCVFAPEDRMLIFSFLGDACSAS